MVFFNSNLMSIEVKFLLGRVLHLLRILLLPQRQLP
jgi:hypothetical protein